MDSSVAAIVAAFISAAASVIVALIGRSPAASRHRDKSSALPVASPTRNKRAWTVAIVALAGWMFLSPPLIHWDWIGINFYVLPVVTLLLSVAFPIRSFWAAATVLILYPLNFLLLPIEWQLRSGDGHSIDAGGVAFLLALAFANAGLSWGICRWLRRGNDATSARVDESGGGFSESSVKPGSIADEIAKLNSLRESGALSNDEFQRAKNRLIDSTP